jgi:diaminohydroxyphosphoribosylaminopyrimidine deaminase/5-amino-6-(5-phosphoribosylamino)uracil reductase
MTLDQALLDRMHMIRALELAQRGEGFVEPNPLVGCVLADDHGVVGEGWHQRFGGPHAEVMALDSAGPRAAGATLYVTLEPCRHFGKTPPCVAAIARARVRRVVAAMRDPFPEVSGRGLAELAELGIQTEVGVLESDARRLNAPYLKLLATGRPWIIAKWAMTLDGKIATATGESRWISGPEARAVVHALRGRVDGIMVGRNTAQIDDPLLTARPPGARIATRIVVDSQATLSPTSQLARTAREAPALVAAASDAPAANVARLRAAGCEVLQLTGDEPAARLAALLEELGRRRLTNVLVEGGGQLLGGLLDAGQLDEAHVFIATRIVGGAEARSPIAGRGVGPLADALRLDAPLSELCGNDLHVHGRVLRAGGF